MASGYPNKQLGFRVTNASVCPWNLSKMDYSRFLSDLAKRRKGTILRDLYYLQQAGGEDWIFLIGGLPNESLFPITRGELTMVDGMKINLTKELVKESFQYGGSSGYPPLIQQLETMTKKYHNPPLWSERMVAVINGCQDGLSKTMDMILNPGDYVLMEEPAYSSVLSIILPYAPKYLPLETDEYGLKPESLKAVLSRWNPEEMSKATKGVPKFLYTNPNGCNPSGFVLSTERKRQIYQICCQYNLLIVEDDPYYFQQYTLREEYPPSFLAMDTENRVIRFESFSKTVGGGLRIGFVVGPTFLVQKLIMHQQTSTQHPANISQVIISEMLKNWGDEGFEKHLKTIKDFYIKQRNALIAASNKYLEGLCEWTVPMGGLFLWVKVNTVKDVWEMIMERAASKKIVLVPGNAFFIDDKKPCQYVRVAFSHISIELMDEACKRFGEMIKEEMRVQTAKG